MVAVVEKAFANQVYTLLFILRGEFKGVSDARALLEETIPVGLKTTTLEFILPSDVLVEPSYFNKLMSLLCQP
jgi:hypothetical protein